MAARKPLPAVGTVVYGDSVMGTRKFKIDRVTRQFAYCDGYRFTRDGYIFESGYPRGTWHASNAEVKEKNYRAALWAKFRRTLPHTMPDSMTPERLAEIAKELAA